MSETVLPRPNIFWTVIDPAIEICRRIEEAALSGDLTKPDEIHARSLLSEMVGVRCGLFPESFWRRQVELSAPVIRSFFDGVSLVEVRVLVSRDGKSSEYRGFGGDVEKAFGDVVRVLLDDPVTAEWLP